MPRTALWKTIAETLRREIGGGAYAPGDRLPTEAALSARFGVNRHTVRRAMAALAEEALVDPRRGAGVFVAARPAEYPLGRRVRYHQSIRAAGRTPEKRVLALETRAGTPAETEALGLGPGEAVLVYEGLSLVDGQAVALFRSVFSEARLPGLADALGRDASVTRALEACGVADYMRASTRLTAKRAGPVQAHHLRIAEGAPILRTVSVNVDPGGVPVEYGRTWFAGDRVTLTVEPE
jgi:GntR family phosphonate transport system transcriptional regulator